MSDWRNQALFVIRRKQLYYVAEGSWTPKVELAKVGPKKTVERICRLDIGLDGCEMVPVKPVLLDQTQTIVVRMIG